ncbi:hypothetical protein HQ531_10825 [bacterium]|nr:hypothetical protein [bacterium]
MFKKKPAKIIGMGFLVVFAIFAIASITMLLWNWLIPTIFNGPSISYLQAIGLLVLSKILLSGGPGKRHHGHHCSNHSHWKEHLRERMDQEHGHIHTHVHNEADEKRDQE